METKLIRYIVLYNNKRVNDGQWCDFLKKKTPIK